MKGYHDENALYHSAQLVAHLLTTGGVIAFCIQHTDTRPANERAFYWTKIIRTGENNNANIQTGTRASHQRRHLPGEPDGVIPPTVRRPSGDAAAESADIDSKDDLKSLLLVDSALRITALGDTVTIQALSANGAALLELLDGALPSGIINQRQPNGRILTFPAVSALLDEDARLCSLSVFDAFRLLQELVSVPDNEREAMFFGGLFAYDLVAGFEDLPQLQSDTACPDYCFYLAETLLVIDHQTKHTRIQASLFTPLRVKNSAWSSA